ncbi:MAG: rhomboid family intramembrane serine protease [archaeon]|nr:rhomboid family intramembrane serine protease [archaeon]
MVEFYKLQKKRFLGFSVNTNIILLNIACFIIFSILLWKWDYLLDYIALRPSNILQGKYLWTFFTSMFMHAGFFHIFANMVSLIFIGSLVQRIIGSKRYFYLYLISGLFAGLFFVLSGLVFPSDYNTYAVGASGAIFGLIGFLMIITPNLPVYVLFIPIPIKMKYAAPGMLIVLWLISIAGNVPIGNMAHLGGLIAGLAYGFYLRQKYKNKTRAINKFFS